MEKITVASAVDTPLNDQEALVYSQKFGPEDSHDYDMQGWFKDNYEPGVDGKGAVLPDHEGHYVDTYKKPNHMTFSTESKYNGVDGAEGGQWEKKSDGSYNFTPGRTNLENHSPQELQNYFDQYEKGNTLTMPPTDWHSQFTPTRETDDRGRPIGDRRQHEVEWAHVLNTVDDTSNGWTIPAGLTTLMGQHADMDKIQDPPSKNIETRTDLSEEDIVDMHNQVRAEWKDRLNRGASPEELKHWEDSYSRLADEYNAFREKTRAQRKEVWDRADAIKAGKEAPTSLGIDAGLYTPLKPRKPQGD